MKSQPLVKVGLYIVSGVLLLGASLLIAWYAVTGAFRRAP